MLSTKVLTLVIFVSIVRAAVESQHCLFSVGHVTLWLSGMRGALLSPATALSLLLVTIS